jgi:CRISPR/Cas system-associated exonuclease Cas4 (RecB family)
MVPPELRQDPHVSFTQLDTYLRCPLRYRLQYVDRVEPDFVPAALALGSGIHGAAALLFRGIANVRLYRLAAEILAAVEAGVFPPRVGRHCQDCPVRSRCWAWG